MILQTVQELEAKKKFVHWGQEQPFVSLCIDIITIYAVHRSFRIKICLNQMGTRGVQILMQLGKYLAFNHDFSRNRYMYRIEGCVSSLLIQYMCKSVQSSFGSC